METVQRVRVARFQTSAREYDGIEVCVGGLRLRCDVTNMRDINLAERLAKEQGAMYDCDPLVFGRYDKEGLTAP